MIAEIAGAFFFDFLFWPAEWVIERLWRLHRREPAWRRWLGGAVLSVLTVLVVLGYIALLIAAAIGVYLVVAGQL